MRGWCVTPHFQDQRSKVKVTLVFGSFYHVRSVAPYLFHRFTSYEVHTQPMRSQCVTCNFKVIRSKVKVTLVIWSFFHVRFVASYLCDRITSYVAYIQHMRGAMCHTPFSGWKRRWSTSHGSFKVLALSAPWFCPYLTESLHICGIHTTHEGTMCRISFPGWKVNGQGHTGPLDFYLVRSVAFSLLDQITSDVAYIQHMRGRCVAHQFLSFVPLVTCLSEWPLAAEGCSSY